MKKQFILTLAGIDTNKPTIVIVRARGKTAACHSVTGFRPKAAIARGILISIKPKK